MIDFLTRYTLIYHQIEIYKKEPLLWMKADMELSPLCKFIFAYMHITLANMKNELKSYIKTKKPIVTGGSKGLN